VDLLETSEQVLATAASIARDMGASVDVVYTIMPPRPVGLPNGLVGMALSGPEMAEMEKEAFDELEQWVDARKDLYKGVAVRPVLLTGFPTRQLAEYAEENDFDGIVIGTVSRSAFDQFMLGSVASGIVRHMPTTVILTAPGKR
jgi:nucleotide-binding universal stress UspA family protein